MTAGGAALNGIKQAVNSPVVLSRSAMSVFSLIAPVAELCV